MTLDELSVVIKAETSGFKKAMKAATKEVQAFDKNVSSIGKSFENMNKSATKSMEQVSKSVSKVVKDTDENITRTFRKMNNPSGRNPFKAFTKKIEDEKSNLERAIKDYRALIDKGFGINASKEEKGFARKYAGSLKQKERELVDNYSTANLFRDKYITKGRKGDYQWVSKEILEAQKKLEEVLRDFDALESKINGLRGELAQALSIQDNNAIAKINIEIEEMIAKLAELGRQKKELQEQVDEGLFELDSHKLQNEFNGMKLDWAEDFKSIFGENNEFNKFNLDGLVQGLDKTRTSMKDIIEMVDVEGEALDDLGNVTSITTQEAVVNWTAVASSVANVCLLLRQVYKITSSISDKVTATILPYLKVVVTYIDKAYHSLAKMLNKINPFAKVVKGLNKMLKVLAGRMEIVATFTILSQVFREVSESFGAMLKTNEELGSSLGKLRGAFLTAFKPLYDTVVPIVITLVNWLTALMYRIGSLIQLLTGMKLDKSGTEALYNEAEALKGVGGAAEEAKKQLASFDELDILKEDKGGGAGGADDWAKVDFGDLGDLKTYKSWGEWFSDWLDRCIAWLPKFNEVMKGAANSINGFNDNLYEMLTYIDTKGVNVQEKVSILTQGIAKGFNNMVEQIDWLGMGHALGQGLNTITNVINNFTTTFDWYALGQGIATNINGALHQIDWEALGQTLVSGWNAVWQTFNGFVQQIDWTQLKYSIFWAIESAINNIDLNSFAESVNKVVTGLFEVFNTVVLLIDWDEFGRKVGEALDKIDWATIIENLMTFKAKIIHGLWQAFKSAVGEIDWSEIAKGLWDGFVGGIALKLETMWEQIGAIFEGIISFIKGIFGIHSPSTVMAEMGDNLVQGLYDGMSLSEAWESFHTTMSEKLTNIKTWCSDTWEEVKTGTATKWEEIKGTISTSVGDVALGINTWLTTQAGNVGEGMKSFTENIGEGLKTAFESFDSFWSDTGDGISEWAKGMSEWAFNGIKGVAENIGNGVSNAIGSLNQMVSAYKNAKNEAYTNFTNSSVGQALVKAGKDVWSAATKYVSSIFTGIKLPSLSNLIPHFANGGVLNSPTVGLMGEYSGARTNPEIVTPESKMRDVFNEGNEELATLLDRNNALLEALLSKDNSIVIGDDVISASAARGGQAYKRRTGRNQFAL